MKMWTIELTDPRGRKMQATIDHKVVEILGVAALTEELGRLAAKSTATPLVAKS